MKTGLVFAVADSGGGGGQGAWAPPFSQRTRSRMVRAWLHAMLCALARARAGPGEALRPPGPWPDQILGPLNNKTPDLQQTTQVLTNSRRDIRTNG